MSDPSESAGGGRPPGRARTVGPLLLALLLLLLAAGGAIYRVEVEAVRERARIELESVAALKTASLAAWLDERRADASMMAMRGNPLFETAIRPLLAAPDDAALGARVQAPLEAIRRIRRYEAAMIVSAASQQVLVRTGRAPAALEPAALAAVQQALQQPGPVLGELHQAGEPAGVVLDIVHAYRDDGGQPQAVLVLRAAARRELFTLVQMWPTPSRSAETMLVRREGDEVLFLNPLRHTDAPPMTVRRSLHADIVAARASRGETGLVQAGDYRSTEVVADLRPVPGTAWHMVTKVDVDELFADARYRGATTLALTGTLALALLLAALTVRAARRRDAWRARFEDERKQRLALEEHRTTLNSIGDGVLTTDDQGRVRGLNPVAEALTGWPEADARGRSVREVFDIVNEDTRAEVENPVHRVLREGCIVGLANHTLLIARDGTERPIADSGAPVRGDDGIVHGAVLVFRDQTAERDAYNALRASEVRFRRLFEGSADALLLLDIDSRRFVDCNQAALAMLGLDSRDEVLKCHPAELSPAQQPDGRDSHAKAGEMIETARREGLHRFEWMHASSARAPFPVDVILTPIEIDGQRLAVTSWRDISEVRRVQQERERAAQEAIERSRELERFNRAVVDRELRMRELKREIDALRARLGQPPRYGYPPGDGETGGGDAGEPT